MKWNSRRVSAWAYAAPADLRKGFDGLSALVMNELGRDPLSGELYLFVSRNRIRAKVLHWVCSSFSGVRNRRDGSPWTQRRAIEMDTVSLGS